MSENFGIVELQRRTGVHLRTLFYWVESDIIKPVGYGEYRGKKVRRFSEKTVREVSVSYTHLTLPTKA